MAFVEEVSKLAEAWASNVNFDDSYVPYFQIAIGCMALEYLWHTYLDIRQLRVVKSKDPPPDAQELYSIEYIESQRAYSLEKKRFGLVRGVWSFAESFSMLMFVLLPKLWDWSNQAVIAINPKWANEYTVSCVFVLGTMLGNMVTDLPWSAWSTFVIEERHGFNKQTISVFVTDLLKSLALTIVFVPLVIVPIVFMLKRSGPLMPIYLWLLLFSFQLIGMTIYPVIARLFNKYEPLPEGSLRKGIERMAQSLNFPLKKLFVVDGSRRSGHSNAYMYGFWRNKRIVLFDTLIEQASEDQILAVLAHELGHWKLGHTLRLMAASQFVLLTRAFEFQADNFAVKLQRGEELVGALRVLEKENKSDFVVDRLYSAYHFSHPPMQERIAAIRSAMAKTI